MAIHVRIRKSHEQGCKTECDKAFVISIGLDNVMMTKIWSTVCNEIHIPHMLVFFQWAWWQYKRTGSGRKENKRTSFSLQTFYSPNHWLRKWNSLDEAFWTRQICKTVELSTTPNLVNTLLPLTSNESRYRQSFLPKTVIPPQMLHKRLAPSFSSGWNHSQSW